MASAVASKSEEKKSKAQAPAAAHDGVFQLEASAGAVAGLPRFLRDDNHGFIRRSCSCGGSCSSCQTSALEEKPLLAQRKPAGPGEAEVDAGVIPAGSSGHPLGAKTREFLESRTGAGMDHVRVHTDGASADSAAGLHADAYTVGQHIYFGTGKYNPDSEGGKRLIAHEVAHTIQQGKGGAAVAPALHATVKVGAVNDPAEREADAVADMVMSPAGTAIVPLSSDREPAVRRGWTDALSDAWDATGGRAWDAAKEGASTVAGEVSDLASDAWDAAKDTAAAFIDTIAPGLLPFLRDVGGAIFDKLSGGLGGLLGGISARIQNQGVAGAIAGLLGDLAGSLGKSLGQLVNGSCQSMVQAASSIIGFVKEIGGEAFAELGKMASAVGGFFSDLWNDLGAPALAAIRKVAGSALDWIEEKAAWVWDKLEPIRAASSTAWNWIKEQFNIAVDEGSGVLDWLYDKAKELWFKIRDKIAPILGPLKMVAGALLLLSPLGPIILIWKGAPVLWDVLKWIWTHGLKPAGAQVNAWFREYILPQLLSGVAQVESLLDQASAFLCGHAGAIASGLRSLQEALSGVPFLSLASGAVGLAAGFFESLSGKGGCKFSDVVGAVKSVLSKIYDFAKPVLEILRQAVLIATLGPWALLDDGVWATLNRFIAFAKRTPCVREIAGLLHVDGVMETVGSVRAYLKDIWKVISDQDEFEAAIHKALDGMVSRIPGRVEEIAGAASGLDGPHLHVLLNHFLVPKLASLFGHWKDLLTGMIWDLVWPWPGVMKDVDEAKKHIGQLKDALWDFQFSKASDAGLTIWRDVNGIIGHLYGWFFIASVLIGAVFASPQAGAAVALEVGEVLLASTIAAEVLTVGKSRLNLMSADRRALTGKARETQDHDDYEEMAGSIVNLGVLGVMSVLGEIAADFAKAVFAEIKGIFLPEGEAPATADIPSTTEKPAPEAPQEAPKSETPANKAEAEDFPKAQFEGERAQVREKAAHPEEVHEVSDTDRAKEFDAEIEIEDHTYDRVEEDKSWCRHSKEICHLNLGDDVNAEVDQALRDKRAEYEDKYGDLDDDRPKRGKMSRGKPELENSKWLKDEEPNPQRRQEFMEWLKREPEVAGEEPLRAGTPEAEAALDDWRAEENVEPGVKSDEQITQEAEDAYRLAKTTGYGGEFDEAGFIQKYKEGDVFDQENRRWKSADAIPKETVAPFPENVTLDEAFERLTGEGSDSSFKAYNKMLQDFDVATEGDVRNALDGKLKAGERSIGDIRHGLKEEFRGKVLDRMFKKDGKPLDLKASQQEMLDMTSELNSSDKGTLAEDWVDRATTENRKAAADAAQAKADAAKAKANELKDKPGAAEAQKDAEAAQAEADKAKQSADAKDLRQVDVKANGENGMKGDRRLDRVEGDTVVEIKSGKGKFNPDEIGELDDHLSLVDKQGAITDAEGNAVPLKSVRWKSLDPKGAKANAEFMKTRLSAAPEALSWEITNDSFETKVFTSENAGEIDAFLGIKPKK